MKKVTLKRTSDNGNQTTGLFMFEDGDKIITLGSLERPWKDNAKNISCIPKGVYQVTITYSPAFKCDMWLVNDVVNRSGIRIHSANYFHQLEGCIALGLSIDDIDGDGNIDLINSRAALNIAKEHLGDSFELTIL